MYPELKRRLLLVWSVASSESRHVPGTSQAYGFPHIKALSDAAF